MTVKRLTITSKNQITLPASIVRNLKLSKNRVVTVEQRGTKIILDVEPSLETRMKKYWDDFHRTHPNFKLTPDHIHTEAGDAYEAYFKDGDSA